MDLLFCDKTAKVRTVSNSWCEHDQTNKTPMAAAPYFFQILLPGWNDGSSGSSHRSVVVEVVPGLATGGTIVTGDKEKTEREVAEGEARRAAAEISQGEFESAAEPDNAIAQIGALPEEIADQPPALQRAGVRAWLLSGA
jgi:hypothetical protein